MIPELQPLYDVTSESKQQLVDFLISLPVDSLVRHVGVTEATGLPIGTVTPYVNALARAGIVLKTDAGYGLHPAYRAYLSGDRTAYAAAVAEYGDGITRKPEKIKPELSQEQVEDLLEFMRALRKLRVVKREAVQPYIEILETALAPAA